MMNSQRDDLIDKVTALVRSDFAGSWQLAWDYFDVNRDDRMSKVELTSLLVKAKIGNRMTRILWCTEIVNELDKDGDGMVSRDEFFDVFRE